MTKAAIESRLRELLSSGGSVRVIGGEFVITDGNVTGCGQTLQQAIFSVEAKLMRLEKARQFQ